MPDTAPVPFSMFRADLAGYLDRAKRGERFVISRHGADEAVLISSDEWARIAETLEIIGDPELFRQIVDSQRDIEAGRVVDAREAFDRLDVIEHDQ